MKTQSKNKTEETEENKFFLLDCMMISPTSDKPPCLQRAKRKNTALSFLYIVKPGFDSRPWSCPFSFLSVVVREAFRWIFSLLLIGHYVT